MITLAIEALTYTGSVAVIRDGHRGRRARNGHAWRARRATHAGRCRRASSAAGVAPNAIDRVVCGAGPGSFTSLRIAGAIAKGLALERERAALSRVVAVAHRGRRAARRLRRAVTSRCSTPCAATCSPAAFSRHRLGDRHRALVDDDRRAHQRSRPSRASTPRDPSDPAEERSRMSPHARGVASLGTSRCRGRRGRPRDLGAGLRTSGRSAGEVGNGARTGAHAAMTDTRARHDAGDVPPRHLTIRGARRDDVDDVAAIERRAFSDPWSANSFRALFGNPLVHFAVAEDAITGRLARLRGDVVRAWTKPRSRTSRCPTTLGARGWRTAARSRAGHRERAAVRRRVSRGPRVERRPRAALYASRGLRGGRPARQVLP